MRIDIVLFENSSFIPKKVKWHYLELKENFIHFRANYLGSETNDNGLWNNIWRFWDETYLKKNIAGWGFYKASIFNEEETQQNESEWVWEFKITISGSFKDIIVLFDAKEKVESFKSCFDNYMAL